MRIAALQMAARAGDVSANLAMIEEAAIGAKAEGAALLVAPELAVTGYGAGDAIRNLADRADGSQATALRRIAGDHGVTIVTGFAERDGDALYNSALLASPDGRTIIYRKCHLYGSYERSLFTPGEAPAPIVEIGGLKIGLLICYDVEFPEAVRRLALDGAELILVPTALPASDHAAFIAEKLVPVRAFENQVAIAYANHCGADERFAYAGRSSIVMPDGGDAARAPASGSALLLADFEPSRFAASRAANPYLNDRRPALLPAAHPPSQPVAL